MASIDPIRFEVMRCAFQAAADEMAAALRKAAYSTNIKTRADFSCALFDDQIRIIAQSFSQPIHLASMARLVPLAVNHYGTERLRPGDALVTNNSHNGSMHLNDICLISPFFTGGRLRGYVAAVAHHVDIGGMAPGGLCVSREIYQEGIIIPSIRLIAGGQVVQDVFDLILANIRSPDQTAGDIRAQIASIKLGQARMEQSISRFGADTVQQFTAELIDYTKRWARQEILDLPDGEYRAEGTLDDDGINDSPIKLCLSARVANGQVFFDLTGSDAQRPGPMNANLTYSYSAVSYVVKSLIDSAIPTNDGFYQLIDVTAPAGTVVNAVSPAGVVGGNDIALRLCDLGFKAFAEVLPNRVPACSKSMICNMGCGGQDPRTGRYYTFMETVCGGYGGRHGKDGIDAVQPHIQNTENSAIEETEHQYPIRILRYELLTDSDGAGQYRGGLGVRRDWQFYDHDATVTVFADMCKARPWGLAGGLPGAASRYVVNPDGCAAEQPSKTTLHLSANDVISYRTPGGGGFGDPRSRDPQAVLADVWNGKVSKQRARNVYAVVIEDDQVDDRETRRLRGC